MADKSYYDILGINSTATLTEVAAAYANLAADIKATPQIEEAYQTLSDPEKRRAYDEDLNSIPFQKPNTLKSTLWAVAKVLLKIGVAALLLSYVFSKIDKKAVGSMLHQSNPWWVVVAVLSFFVSTIVAASRLMSFFKSIGLNVRWQFNLRLYMLGMFYNLFLPGGIGGDGYKIYLLNKSYNMPAKKVFWALLFDRLSGFWAIGFLAAVLSTFLPQLKALYITPITAWGGFLVISAIYYFVINHFFKDYTKHFFAAHLKAIGVQALQILTISLVLIGLHYNGAYPPYLIAFLASSMAAVIPLSPGGLGFREFIYKYVVEKIFHLNGDLAVILSISFYVISAVISLLGLYYFFKMDKLEKDLPQANKK